MSVHVVKAISDVWILPTTPMEASSNLIELQGCPSEYLSASFVVHAGAAGISGLTPVVSGAIANWVDIRVVKCWWIANTCTHNNDLDWQTDSHPGDTLAPELLLKDDSLIDLDATHNYVRDINGNWIDATALEGTSRPIANFNVEDANTLQPIDIPANTNKQFWLTIKIPASAAAGIYNGTIAVGSDTILLEVEVLPFELLEPYMVYSMMYFGALTGTQSIGVYGKNETQFRAEVQNLIEHGVKHPTFNTPYSNMTLWAQAIAIFRQYGAISPLIIYNGRLLGLPNDPSSDAQLETLVRQLVNASPGFAEVYFSLVQETSVAGLTSQRSHCNAIHNGGGLVYTSFGYAGGSQAMGDVIDLVNWPYDPSAAEAGLWHSEGDLITSYGNPQCGVEKPARYRRNYGLLLWQRDFDGTMPYGFQAHDSPGFAWSDWDSNSYVVNLGYRNETMSYPTIGKPIDTIEWEGFREAVNDIRYLTTLLNAVAAAPAGAAKTNASNYLAGLKTANLANQDLDVIRATMIDHLLALGGSATIQINTNRTNAPVRVNNVWLPTTGSQAVTVPEGTYNVYFGDVSGYNPPVPREFNGTIAAGQTVTVTGNYSAIPVLAHLVITTSPVSAPIYVNGTLEGAGSTALDLAAGSYIISFGEVAGYDTPASRQVTVAAADLGHTLPSVEGVYIPFALTATLAISTTPVVGLIYVNGSLVGNGALEVDVDPGTYIISFGDMPDQVTPDPQTIVVTQADLGMEIPVVGTYGAQTVYGSLGMVGLVAALLAVLGLVKKGES